MNIILNIMHCPNCKRELKKNIHNAIELNQCINCGGIWFDGDKLRIVKDKDEELLRWLDIDLFSDPKKFTGGYSTMTCPQDKETLYEISYDNTDIKVDVCRTCRGVWLDKGEYESIIAFLKRMIFREDARQYLKHLENKIKEVFTDKEDMILELKDAITIFRLLENRIVSQWPRIEEIIISLRLALLK